MGRFSRGVYPFVYLNRMESVKSRFDKYIKKTNGCWEWTGGIKSTGRGMFWLKGKGIQSHRMAWILENGAIPDKMCVLHKCDNGKCVRVEHLFIGTLKDNTQDMLKKKRHVGNRKINLTVANEIRGKYKFRKNTMDMLAKEYGVCYATIFNVIHKMRTQID